MDRLDTLERVLDISQIEPDQPACQHDCRNPAGAAQPVNRRFADLKLFCELSRC
jgi:hypothetical protein